MRDTEFDQLQLDGHKHLVVAGYDIVYTNMIKDSAMLLQ